MDPISIAQAASAYSKTSTMGAAAEPAHSIADDFSSLLTNALSGASDSLQKAEQISTQSVLGAKTDLTSLVGAISNAELTLNTIISIRDRAISAYQDIIKMPI